MLRTSSRRALSAFCAAALIAGALATGAGRNDAARAEIPTLEINLIADGSMRQVRTSQNTVGGMLNDAGVKIGPADIVTPSLTTRIQSGASVRVIRVQEKVVVEDQPIGYKARKQPTTSLRIGLAKTISEGKNGLKHVYYKVRYEDGTEKGRSVIRSEVVRAAQDRVTLIGERGYLASRGWFSSRKTMTMRASAYDPGPKSCGKYADGTTCTGMRAGYGVVAVDPRVIRLGTKLYIEGYGFAIAADRGRAIKGNRIDLGYDTYREAIRFGRKTVKVHILD